MLETTDRNFSRPLEITGVVAEGNVYHLVFLALKDTAYRLYYGSEAAERPSYDMAVVLAWGLFRASRRIDEIEN